MLRQSDTMRVYTVPPWGPWMLGEVVRGELRGRSRPAAPEAAYGGLWPGPPTILYFPQEEPAGASLSVQMGGGISTSFQGRTCHPHMAKALSNVTFSEPTEAAAKVTRCPEQSVFDDQRKWGRKVKPLEVPSCLQTDRGCSSLVERLRTRLKHWVRSPASKQMERS